MDGYVTIGTELDTKSFETQIKQVEKELKFVDNMLEKRKEYKLSGEAIEKFSLKAEKLRNQLIDLRKKQDSLNKQGFADIKGSIDNVGKSVEKVTKKVGKWALAIFGVRSAYMFVRKSINTITENDPQLKADLDYIKTALAYTIEPLVRGIVNFAKELMFYVGYIVKAFTGYNIFANANKGLATAEKNAKGLNKELNKTTASFDEMNTLQESSTGGASDTVLPSFDFRDFESMPVPEWLDFIVKHKNEILDVLAGIAGGLGAIKLGLSGIQALGIGIAVAGLVRAIQKIIDFIKKPTFKNFMGILEGIAITVAGIGIAFAAWPLAIAGALGLMVVEIVNHFDEIMKIFNRFTEWIDKDFRKIMRDLFGPIGDIITNVFSNAVNYAKDLFEGFYGGIKRIVDGVVKIFKGDFLGGIKDVFGGLLDIITAPFNAMKNTVERIFTDVVNFIIDAINVLIDGLNKIKIPGTKIGINLKRLQHIGTKSTGSGGGFRAKGGIFYPSKLPKLAVGGIINQPGRGVPYNGAIIGERGAEAVVPLTDSQQMALLGETIGRYVNISATIPVYVGNRKVAREVRKIQANEDFAFNR